jgi:hypothetical protein
VNRREGRGGIGGERREGKGREGNEYLSVMLCSDL